MSTFSLGGKMKLLFSKTGLLLLIGVISLAIFGSCAQKSDVDANIKITTATKEAVPALEGLTSLEAEALAWTKADGIFKNQVLFRLAPVETSDSTEMRLSTDWQNNDRSAAWSAWYADSDSGDWFMVNISGKNIVDSDIGTRSFSTEAFNSTLPKESTPVSMKAAAAAAKAQGANMDWVTWVEYLCEFYNSSPSRLPMWVFSCSVTPETGTQLNYKIYVNAATGEVEGAKNDRNEELKLPINIEEMQKPKTENHEADLRKFFSFISGGDPIWAVRQLAYSLSPDEATGQVWLANFQSITTLEIVSIEQANLAQWTDEWESYMVVLNITTSEPVEKYGWETGENTRWITLVPQGAGDWKISAIGTGP